MTHTTIIFRKILRTLWIASIGFILYAATAAMPPAASADAAPPGCIPGEPPVAANVPCEGWPVTSAPPPTGVLCKLELYNAAGTSIAPASTDTCYPPGITPPPGSFPCMVIVSATAYGQGYCTSQTTGALPPGYTVPPPPPPPTPPVVSAASCTKAPPSTWYDPQDPTHGIPSVAPAWMGPAQNIASTLFKALFLFEIFMLGLQAVLHRNDITHLFSGLAFKTFVATFFIYLMSFSPTFLPQVFGSFQIAGQSVGSSNGGNLMSMYHQADSAAELFFCAAMASHIDDHETALEYGYFGNMPDHPGIPYNGDVSHTLQGAIGHITFEFFVQGLGILVIAGTGIMFLSLAVITGESYITMFAGVFFIGFSSMRFTLPFTQGYLSYAVNVGVKMFTYWVLIEVESTILMPILLRAGTGLINAASIQFGPGSEVYLMPAAVDVVQIVGMGALTWFLPNILGRFVSGRNSSSAVHVISNLAKSLKNRPLNTVTESAGEPAPQTPIQLSQGAIPMMPFKETMLSIAQPAANMGFSNPFSAQAQAFVSPSSPTSAAAASAAASTNNGATISGVYQQPVQASVSDGTDPFAFKPKVEPIVIPWQARNKRTAPPRQSQAARPNPPPTTLTPNQATLDQFSAQQLKLLPSEEFTLLLKATSFDTLGAEHLKAIEEDERLRSIADTVIPQRRRAPEAS